MIPALLQASSTPHLPFYASIKTRVHHSQPAVPGHVWHEGCTGRAGAGRQPVYGRQAGVFRLGQLPQGGLVYADELTTVSPSYAEEIQTAFYGERLDGLLRARRNHLTGVLNGIDMQRLRSRQRPCNRAARSRADNLSGKAACKSALQQAAGPGSNGPMCPSSAWWAA